VRHFRRCDGLLESQGIVVNTPYRGKRLMAIGGLHRILVVRLEQIDARDAAAASQSDRSALKPLEQSPIAICQARSSIYRDWEAVREATISNFEVRG